jgi:hypothetical protein
MGTHMAALLLAKRTVLSKPPLASSKMAFFSVLKKFLLKRVKPQKGALQRLFAF